VKEPWPRRRVTRGVGMTREEVDYGMLRVEAYSAGGTAPEPAPAPLAPLPMPGIADPQGVLNELREAWRLCADRLTTDSADKRVFAARVTSAIASAFDHLASGETALAVWDAFRAGQAWADLGNLDCHQEEVRSARGSREAAGRPRNPALVWVLANCPDWHLARPCVLRDRAIDAGKLLRKDAAAFRQALYDWRSSHVKESL